jgi:hypothetical protein
MFIIELVNKWYMIMTSICRVKKEDIDDLEEPLLSKCENDITNMIIENNRVQACLRPDPNSYVINHMQDGYEPPFAT